MRTRFNQFLLTIRDYSNALPDTIIVISDLNRVIRPKLRLLNNCIKLVNSPTRLRQELYCSEWQRLHRRIDRTN